MTYYVVALDEEQEGGDGIDGTGIETFNVEPLQHAEVDHPVGKSGNKLMNGNVVKDGFLTGYSQGVLTNLRISE